MHSLQHTYTAVIPALHIYIHSYTQWTTQRNTIHNQTQRRPTYIATLQVRTAHTHTTRGHKRYTQVADIIAKYFVPTVITISFITFVVWCVWFNTHIHTLTALTIFSLQHTKPRPETAINLSGTVIVAVYVRWQGKMRTYMNIYIHAYIHTHTYIHTNIQTYKHTNISIHT